MRSARQDCCAAHVQQPSISQQFEVANCMLSCMLQAASATPLTADGIGNYEAGWGNPSVSIPPDEIETSACRGTQSVHDVLPDHLQRLQEAFLGRLWTAHRIGGRHPDGGLFRLLPCMPHVPLNTQTGCMHACALQQALRGVPVDGRCKCKPCTQAEQDALGGGSSSG